MTRRSGICLPSFEPSGFLISLSIFFLLLYSCFGISSASLHSAGDRFGSSIGLAAAPPPFRVSYRVGGLEFADVIETATRLASAATSTLKTTLRLKKYRYVEGDPLLFDVVQYSTYRGS